MGDIVAWIAAGIAFVSFIVSIFTFVWTGVRDRRQATLEAVNRLQAEVFDKLNGYTLSYIKENSLNRRSEKYKELSAYLSRINHFAVGIFEKIYDKKTFYKLVHGYFDCDAMKNKLNVMIYARNKGSQNGESHYSATTELIEWMDKTSQKHTRTKN